MADANLIYKYIEGMESMLVPLGATIACKSVYRGRFPQDDLLIVSTLEGQIEGKFIIGMSECTFQAVSQIFQVPGIDDQEMKNSFLREIGNMVMGHANPKFQQSGFYANMIEIHCYDGSQIASDSLKKAECVSVEVNVNGIYPLMIYFIENCRSSDLGSEIICCRGK